MIRKKSKIYLFIFVIFFLFFYLFNSFFNFTPSYLSRVLKGQELIVLGNYDKALAIYKDLLKENLEKEIKIKVLLQLVELEGVFHQNYKESVFYLKILEKEDDSLSHQILISQKLADYYFSKMKKFHLAKEYYQKLLSITPKLENYDFLLYRFILSLFYQEEWTELIDELKSALKRPSFLYFKQCIFLMGQVNFYQGHFDESIAFLKKFLTFEGITDDLFLNAQFLMANAFEEKGDFLNAYKIYLKIKKTYPNPDIIAGRLNALLLRKNSQMR